jgi:hypothetical protein
LIQQLSGDGPQSRQCSLWKVEGRGQFFEVSFLGVVLEIAEG